MERAKRAQEALSCEQGACHSGDNATKTEGPNLGERQWVQTLRRAAVQAQSRATASCLTLAHSRDGQQQVSTSPGTRSSCTCPGTGGFTLTRKVI